jgi:PAS domain S-box-containing protein
MIDLLGDQTSEGFVIHDHEGRIIKFNQRALEILGLSSDQILGKTSVDPNWRTLSASGRPLAENDHPAMLTLRTGTSLQGFVMGVERPTGHVIWLSINSVPIDNTPTGQVAFVLSTFLDITQYRNQNENLLTLEAGVAETAIVSVTDAKGDILSVNQKFIDISGYSREELLGKNHRILKSGKHSKEFFNNLWQTIRDGAVWSGDVCNKAKSGRLYWVHSTIVPIRNAQGKIEKYFSLRIEKTERKQQEDRINELLALNTAILNSPRFSIIATDPTGLILHFNTEAERILEYKASEVIGQLTPASFHVPEDVVAKAEVLTHELGQKVPVGFETFVYKAKKGLVDADEWTYVAKSGKQTKIRLSVTCLRDQKGNITGYLGVGEDLTDQKRLEEDIQKKQIDMIHSSRMASLGEMASGVAHEINNPIAIIRSQAELSSKALKREPLDLAKIERGLEKILRTSDRVANIIAGLRTVSRDGSTDPLLPASLDTIIKDTLSLSKARFESKNIDVTVESPTDATIDCRPTQITQVLLNILNNSFDAVSKLETRWVHLKVTPIQGLVILRIEDSGEGIPKPIQEKIFDPFFTTKEVGSGTGLGLSIAAGIMKDHLGSLELDKSAKHTAFILRFPCAKSQTSAA